MNAVVGGPSQQGGTDQRAENPCQYPPQSQLGGELPHIVIQSVALKVKQPLALLGIDPIRAEGSVTESLLGKHAHTHTVEHLLHDFPVGIPAARSAAYMQDLPPDLRARHSISQGKADIVFSPTGGFHHAGKDFAAGFCYINDAVLAIKKWLVQQRRVLYIDIDAHHGDQVQEAFYNTSKAMIVSFHESGRTLFPFKTGFENQIGKGRGKGYTINVPLPENTSDHEFLWAFDQVFLPLAKFFGPDVVIALLGVDALFSDPFSHLQLTNTALVKALESIIQVSPKILVLGSGGYTHENIARTWTLAWATMNGLGPTEEDLATFGGMFWGDGLSSLKDQPRFVPDHVKEKAKSELHRMVHAIEDRVFTILGI